MEVHLLHRLAVYQALRLSQALVDLLGVNADRLRDGQVGQQRLHVAQLAVGVVMMVGVLLQMAVDVDGDLGGANAAFLAGCRLQPHPWDACLSEAGQPGGGVGVQRQQGAEEHITGTAGGTL